MGDIIRGCSSLPLISPTDRRRSSFELNLLSRHFLSEEDEDEEVEEEGKMIVQCSRRLGKSGGRLCAVIIIIICFISSYLFCYVITVSANCHKYMLSHISV